MIGALQFVAIWFLSMCVMKFVGDLIKDVDALIAENRKLRSLAEKSKVQE